ncbi:MAG: 4-(cytidine 5'-diphospho)-2-C-methyl-D-erythritol kinase, partial [Oscillospiraceae bacterium]|nr:4-(cytidine 5'-diphospho)-2-C-methyl-D-erythritol kinase [Oscillospiraceae bacterium]
MTAVQEKACAKLNISLDVTRRREDGYHDMLMVMQAVSLCDEVTITREEGERVRASSNLPFIPSDARNLAVRAALAFQEALGRSGEGLHIRLDKHIPVGAGMAGGSSDAAAVLRALNRMYGQPLDRQGLEALAC